MHQNHEINYNIEYFRDYLKGLDMFLYKESIGLTSTKYYRIFLEIDRIREHIEFLEYIELINIEVTFKEFASFNVNKI